MSFSLNRRLVGAALYSLFVLLVLGCSTLPESTQTPVKSESDDRDYRYLTLANDMQVLLISDPDTRKAAAALDVMVGSGDNPPDRGGLAHFLEHMLFLGTDKYPDPAEYEEYITEHGGNRNAYTSFENTNYFFDINQAYLPEALDRFAQFFVAPRFDADYVQREKNAVEAEYQVGLKSDPRRGLDVLQEVMNPEHPFSQFSVGSLESLADRPGSTVRDELLAFYDKHYSANVMRLVVLGAESLDELQAMVEPLFSAVPNRAYEPAQITAPMFEADALPMLVQIQPQATLRELSVGFPIEDYRAAYRTKPVSYLSHLVGHEGEGSLLSQLKAEGLVESLSAGSGFAWRGGGLFSVNAALTERGVAHYERVLQLLFAYLDLLREAGPQQWVFEEQEQLSTLAFRFRENSEPMNYVSALASGMHYYRAEDTLRGPYVMTDYDAGMLADLLADVVPANALVTLEDSSVATDLVSEHYGVPYARTTLAPAQQVAWQDESVAHSLALPAPNAFIADDVSLRKIARNNPEHPEVVRDEQRLKIWYAQDEEFRLPKGGTYINFRSGAVGRSADEVARAGLYAALLNDAVNEFAYPALVAGLDFSLYKHAQGISLRISGYNDKQAALLSKILETTQDSRFDPRRFENIRQDMIRALENTVAQRPSSQVMGDLREALSYGVYGEPALIAALEAVDEAGLSEYAREFWRGAQAEVLIYGNYSERDVDEVARLVGALLPAGEAPALPPLEVVKLEAGESLLYTVDVPHDDAVIAWYLQGENNTWADRGATALSGQIMKSGFFQQLRTEQQLGYIASSFYWPQLDVPGLVMLLQSPSADAVKVAGAMDTFMRGVEADLDEAQFQRHQAALLEDILRPDKNLWERLEFYWASIAKKRYNFDGREALAEAVRGYDRAGWQAYYNRVFIDQRHSLQVVAPGALEAVPKGGAPVTSPEALKQGHGSYVID